VIFYPAKLRMSDESAKAQRLLEELDRLRDGIARAAPADPDVLGMIHPSHRLSACNLLQYPASGASASTG